MLQRAEELPDDATSRTDRSRDDPSELEPRHELTRCAACCLRLSACALLSTSAAFCFIV